MGMKRLLLSLFMGFSALITHGQINRASFGPHAALPAGDSPIQCAVTDIDRDGRADLVVANHLDSRLLVYRNVGTGNVISASTFAPAVSFTTGSMPHDMAVGDIDGDGRMDVVTGNLGNHTVSLFRNTSSAGTVQFADRIDIAAGGQLPHGVALGDLDGDGRQDLLVACFDSDSVSLFRNMGSGVSAATFPEPAILRPGDGPHTIKAGDLTGDGRPEVVVANFETPSVEILWYVPSPTAEVAPFRTNNFTRIMHLPRGGNALHLGDIDGDGQTDIAVGHWRTQTLAVFRHSDPGGAILRFDPPAELSVGHNIHSVVVRDLDGDSRPELVTVGELSSYMSVFKNLASPGAITLESFGARVDFPSGWNANGLAVEDVEGDGRADIVFANAYDDNVFIYQNRIGDTNIAQPPVFIEQPLSQTVEAGSSATFTVGVTGTPPFGFRWRRNGVTIPNSNTDTFTLHNVQPSDAGVYTVAVTNPAVPEPGVVSAPATLTVIGGTNAVPPTITSHPQSQTVAPGSTVTFSVEATGTQPLNYRWRRNGVYLPVVLGPVLTLNGVTPEYAGVYSVVVSNTAGTRISSNALLRVVTPTNPPPPTIFAFAPPVTFAGGDSPVACAYNDLDNDDKPDLLVINHLSSTLSAYRNQSRPGAIQFAAPVNFATGLAPIAMAVDELVGGGGLDVVTANWSNNTVSVFINRSTTNISFHSPMHLSIGPAQRPRGVAIGDVDGDGAPDIVVAAYDSDSLVILRGRTQIGALLFDPPFVIPNVGDGPSAVTVKDIDADGGLDIVVASHETPELTILRRNRNISPTNQLHSALWDVPVRFPRGGVDVIARDVDGDNRLDILVGDWRGHILSVFRNRSVAGTVVLDAPVDLSMGNYFHHVDTGDLDADGKPELVAVGEMESRMSIFKNLSTPGSLTPGSFSGRVDFPSGWNPHGVVVADVDGDARQDITFANAYDDTITIYRNTLGETNVIEPPRFVVQPQNQTVPVGGTAIFRVEVTGTPPFGYRWRRNGVTLPQPVPGINTLIISNVQPSHAGVYSVIVTNAANTLGVLSSNAVLAVVVETNAPPGPLVRMDHTWRYDQSSNDLSGTFAQPGFDDSTWPAGPAPLGVEMAPLPVPINTPLTLGPITYYFRAALNLTAAQLNSISQFYIDTLIDDGAVVYVNGAEVFRLRMPDGVITWNTFAPGVVGDAMLEGPFYLPNDQFVVGQNIIAVEVHQWALNSTDLVFAMALHGVQSTETNLPPPIITRQPESQTVSAGGTAVFEVETTGAAPLVFRWRRNGVNIPESNTNRLVLSNMQLSDAGVYTVVVSNFGSPAPGVISAPATLTVITEPPPPAVAPVIARIHPTSGPIGSELAIEGTGLVAETNGTPRVRVGGVLAPVLSASPTQLVVRVPAGAMYSPVTVTVSRRTAYSRQRFDVTFPAVERIQARYFSPPVHLPSGPIPVHMAGGDIDGDGYTDLVVANRDGANFTVFRNRGADGGFREGVHFAAGNTPYHLAIGDMDGDGRLDVVTADANSNTASFHKNVSSSGNVSFAPRLANPVGRRPLSIAVGDLNRDGLLDIVTGDYDDHAVSVLYGTGTGSFLPRVTFSTGGDVHFVAIADLSEDGYPDVVAANYQSGTVALLHGTATGTLAPRQLFAGGGNTIALANVDLDDDIDLIVGNYQGSEVRVFDNVGFHTTNQFFAPASFPAGTTPHQVAVGDLNGDGQPDIAAAGEYPSQIGLLQNGSTWGLGTVFGPPELLVAQANETGIVVADFDLDGRPDVAVANAYSSTISWFHNNIPETEPPPEPPVIVRQPQSQSVPVGGTAIFSVETTGTPPLNYGWRFNGVAMANSNTNRLIINNVQPGHAGVYNVVVMNPANPAPGVLSEGATLTVLNTPTNPPPGGNLVSISNVWRYEANGSTNLGTSWRAPDFNDSAWPSGLGLLGFETSPLPFPIQTMLPIGPITYYFRTEVSFDVPTINPFAQFRLRTFVDDGAVVYINGTEALRVGMPAGAVTYNTLASRNTEAAFEGPFLLPPSLFVPGRNVIAVEVHQGQVPSGDVVFGLTLDGQPGGTNVVRPPIITEQPQSQSVEVGGTAVFRVEVTGTPPFGYRWLRNGVTIVPPSLGSNTLIISNVQTSHAGLYRVVVTNAAMSPVASSNAVLTVIGITVAPEITQQPQNQTVPVGGTATFAVQATGTPPPSYIWFKGDEPLGGATNRVLTLTNVQTNHAGAYSVRVSNTAGSVLSTQALLTLTPPEPEILPPVITDFSPQSGPTGTVVTITGDNFHPGVSGNRVYFGAVRARVLTSSTNELTVEAPVGATYEPLSVNTRNRIAFSDRPFMVTFESSRRISAGSFVVSSVPAGDSPVHVSMGDMEGNGRVDFVAANLYSSTVGVYLNGSSNFTVGPMPFGPPRTYPTGPLPFFMTLADLDGMGGLDIITANTENHTISLLRNTPAGVFALSSPLHVRVGQLPIALATGDLDKDGRVDIVVANHDSDSITILRQIVNPFSIVPASPFQVVELPVGDGPHNVVIGDVDGDGRSDIIVANFQTRTMAVLRNLSTGPGITADSFAPPVHFPRGGNCLAFGDIDDDGKSDIVIGNWRTQTLSVFRNVASPGSITLDSLAAPVDFAMGNNPHTIALSDLDGDARLEIVVVGELSSYMSIFKNVSTPGTLNENSFLPRVDFASGWNAVGVAAGDLDGDSRPDLVFANAYDDNLTIYRNRTAEVGTNGPPTATVTTEAAVGFLSEENERMVIDPLHTGVVVCLSGGACSDPERDRLSYEWSLNGEVIGTSASISRTFTLGSHVVTLRVSDGTKAASTSTIVDVITPVEAVERLIALVEASDLPARPKQRIIAILEDTLTIIPHDLRRADTRLERAQRKIQAALQREYPAAAELVNRALEQIICGARCD